MYRFLELNPNDRLPSACEVYDKSVSLLGMFQNIWNGWCPSGLDRHKDKELYQKMASFKRLHNNLLEWAQWDPFTDRIAIKKKDRWATSDQN